VSDADESTIALGQWVVGFLLIPPSLGSSVYTTRFLTDGRIALGEFCTSPVIEINGPYIKTEHSVYKIEKVKKLEVIV
jgi:hypothetical protein